MDYYVVDAFAENIFEGNPAGVCVLTEWLDHDTMQKIAAENNLSETAFVYKRQPGYYELKWFTPKSEINLCGHATLGTAYVITTFVDSGISDMQFETLSGTLKVRCDGNLLTLDFPSLLPERIDMPKGLEAALGIKALEAYLARDLMIVLPNHEAVASLNPDFSKLGQLTEGLGVIVTAASDEVDFVSRCFYPKLGINEDPVTGSAHCNLIPFWSARLGKSKLKAVQLSERRGTIYCELHEDRVLMSGYAKLYLKGEIFLS